MRYEDYMYTSSGRPGSYSPRHVEKKFYEIQSRLCPTEGDNFLFVTINPDKSKKHWFDWYRANNVSNAFDFIIRRVLWKRKGRYIRPYVGALEKNQEGDRYHCHGLIHLVDLKAPLSETCIWSTVEKTILNLSEVGSENCSGINIQAFSFSETTKDYGCILHYMVKSASGTHDPLKLRIYSRSEQDNLYQQQPSQKGDVYGNQVPTKDHYFLRA